MRCLRNSLKLQVHKVDFEVVFAEREKERLRERERTQLDVYELEEILYTF